MRKEELVYSQSCNFFSTFGKHLIDLVLTGRKKKVNRCHSLNKRSSNQVCEQIFYVNGHKKSQAGQQPLLSDSKKCLNDLENIKNEEKIPALRKIHEG